jgi:hypothetical protein
MHNYNKLQRNRLLIEHISVRKVGQRWRKTLSDVLPLERRVLLIDGLALPRTFCTCG